MKVKKFTAPTMPEVMQKVRKELGADAVILHSKAVHTGGFLGLFKKRNIEVVAALDKEPERKKQAEQQVTKPVASEKEVKWKESDRFKADQGMLQELRDLKSLIELNSNTGNLPQYPAAYQLFYKHLLSQDMEEETAERLVSSMYEHNPDAGRDSFVELLTEELAGRFRKDAFEGISYEKKFVHFVGPTGVGKTTTIAKIAANSVLKDNKRVAFITTDTYRIAAIDQLKTYSKILDVPMEIAYNLDDYRSAREKFKDFDLVLVDTAGRNFRDEKYVKELAEIIDLNQDIDTYLVLSLAAKSADLMEIYRQFEKVPIKQLVFTKKDETASYGAMAGLSMVSGKGIAYLTTGQDVPDDIESVDVQKLAKLIVGDFADV
ncbi:flagellar biosynthesis protein FlhF [Sediminibacillus dalangtanensis]|uniref:Flagellar biosynthesis protein FlhF n=1 Tax=Sediminibacillus dalangtanensis TaxID=2729421 RepID=A0ABX7VTW2_9BACI|nr:flagellar biosynthesis protein FlhF [Sediminibacillus dalangtanensis]QTM99429.1 flagellar biosynthesis protein FlhF [Sediminibacillus dalangtanensis]